MTDTPTAAQRKAAKLHVRLRNVREHIDMAINDLDADDRYTALAQVRIAFDKILGERIPTPPTPKPYCIPTNAGLPSEPRAVAKRLATLIETLDSFSWAICTGGVLDDIKGLRQRIIDGLDGDGWFCTYDGGEHMKVYEPGSKTGARKRADMKKRLET